MKLELPVTTATRQPSYGPTASPVSFQEKARNRVIFSMTEFWSSQPWLHTGASREQQIKPCLGPTADKLFFMGVEGRHQDVFALPR